MALPPQANLGGVSFGLATSGIDTMERMVSFKWPAHERIQNRPKHEFTGVGEETFTINAEYFPDVHGENIVGKLRALGAKGNPLTLTTGDGQNLGLWAITEVKSTGSSVMAGGKSRKITFNVSLVFATI